MKPKMQTKFGRGLGNCTSACIASLLGLETDDVPNFALAGYDWSQKCEEWLNERGWRMLKMRFENGEHLAATWFEPGHFVMMGGVSPRSTERDRYNHAVIGGTVGWGIELVHDPHPDKSGILLEHEIWIKFIVPMPVEYHAAEGQKVIAAFLKRVKESAERTIEETHVVTGAHWNAIRRIAREMGIETDI